MPYQNIQVLQDGAVETITINRPDKLNALNQQTLLELSDAFSAAAVNDATRVVVITGSGNKAFVAGADIGEIQELSPIDAHAFSELGQQVMLGIQHLDKPVIAAINGYALGGGCELALACNLRIAGDNALLGLPEIKLGIMPGFGGSQRLTRLIGAGRALEMMLTGEPVAAGRAEQIGLVNQVVEAGALRDTVSDYAERLARAAPHALHGILDAVNKGADLPLEAGLELETDRFALCCATEDMREGTSAFLEKRKPEFRGC